ncbi:MAG: hypothetical protein R2857_00795 [Vampirovibrionales bacterium]
MEQIFEDILVASAEDGLENLGTEALDTEKLDTHPGDDRYAVAV